MPWYVDALIGFNIAILFINTVLIMCLAFDREHRQEKEGQ